MHAIVLNPKQFRNAISDFDSEESITQHDDSIYICDAMDYRLAYPVHLSSYTTWLPQKIICGTLTILNLIWMLELVRASLPKDQKNPPQHINFLICVICENARA